MNKIKIAVFCNVKYGIEDTWDKLQNYLNNIEILECNQIECINQADLVIAETVYMTVRENDPFLVRQLPAISCKCTEKKIPFAIITPEGEMECPSNFIPSQASKYIFHDSELTSRDHNEKMADLVSTICSKVL